MKPSRRQLARLRALAEEPVRKAMPRSQQYPSIAAGLIAKEREVAALRVALREALALIAILESQS